MLFAPQFSRHVVNQRLFAPFNFTLSKAFSTSFVSASNRHLIIQHINFDCSIQDLQLLLVIRTKSDVAGLLHLKPFLKDFSKSLQLLLSCNHTEVVTMTQSLDISIATAEENWARDSDLHGTLSFNTSDLVSPQIDAASRVPYMLLQSLANLPTCSCPSGRNV